MKITSRAKEYVEDNELIVIIYPKVVEEMEDCCKINQGPRLKTIFPIIKTSSEIPFEKNYKKIIVDDVTIYVDIELEQCLTKDTEIDYFNHIYNKGLKLKKYNSITI